jgi:lipopolysaccharide export system protein LptA
MLCMAATLLAASALGAAGQGTEVAFGKSHDASAPVEITSDSLQLDQAGGTALFQGTVKVGQGALRLAADQVKVFYAQGENGAQGAVERMEAEGNVTLSNGTEAAQAGRAVYEVASGQVRMEGDVVLTQGQNALSSRNLDIDLTRGTARLEGRVRTIFTPGSTGAPARSNP